MLNLGNWDDRAPVSALLEGVEGGITLEDFGYRSQQRAEKYAEQSHMLVLTRADAPEENYLLAQVR